MRTTINIDNYLYQQIYHNAEINNRTVSQEIAFWLKQVYGEYEILTLPKNRKE